MKRLTLKISGKVQGVFYRTETLKKAEDLGLLGSVRNLDNGDVEIIAEGEEDALKKFQDWCRVGSELAEVEGVEAKFEEASEEFESFTIRK